MHGHLNVKKVENLVLLLDDIEGAYIMCNNTVTQGVKLKLLFSFHIKGDTRQM